MPRIFKNDIARFWSKVDKHGSLPAHNPGLGPCWKWVGALNKVSGYAPFWVGSLKKIKTAHYFSFTLNIGPLPPGKEIDHLCRNRGCCNPRHLEAVTHRINVLRGDTIPARNATKSHCIRGHERTKENIYLDLQGKRQCRLCEEIRNRQRGWKSGSATDGRVNSGARELSAEQVREMHELYRSGYSYRGLAEKFSVSYSAVEKILRGVRWPQIYRELSRNTSTQLELSAA